MTDKTNTSCEIDRIVKRLDALLDAAPEHIIQLARYAVQLDDAEESLALAEFNALSATENTGKAGLSVPRKSGCWLCPFQSKAQWRELWERYPQLFARAEALEKASSEKRGVVATFDPSGKVTLAQLRLGFESQMDMGFDMDGLREYQPCVCGL